MSEFRQNDTTTGYCPTCARQLSDVTMHGSGFCEEHGRVWADWNPRTDVEPEADEPDDVQYVDGEWVGRAPVAQQQAPAPGPEHVGRAVAMKLEAEENGWELHLELDDGREIVVNIHACAETIADEAWRVNDWLAGAR